MSLSLLACSVRGAKGSPLLAKSLGASHLSGLVELRELVFASVNGRRKSPPHEYVHASCAVSHVFNAKRIGNYFAPSPAIFGTQTPTHFVSGPRKSVKTDWPYSKDRASSARTSSVSSQN